MSIQLTCHQCRTLFSVDDELAGANEYCPSCGAECAVPENADGQSQSALEHAPDATVAPPAKRRARVFADAAFDDIVSQSAGEIACPCGATIRFTIADFGTTVYCPSCARGHAIERTVGDDEQEPELSEAPSSTETDLSQRSAGTRRVNWRWLAGAAAVGVAILVGFAITQRANLAVGFANWGSAPQAPITQPVQTGEAEEGDQTQEPVDEELVVEITLEAIEGLLRAENRRMALYEGQLWRQELANQGVPADEARLVRLDEVIAILVDELSPEPQGAPPEVDEFRQLVNRLRDSLAAEDLEEARQWATQADDMLHAHAEVLAPQARRYMKLKARLEELEGRRDGVRRITRLLNDSRRAAEQGQAPDAMVARAEALNLARSATWISTEEEQQLRSMVNELRDVIRLARGQQAITDAKRCQEAGDRLARDRELDLAREVLPGLSQDVIRPLFGQIAELEEENVRSVATPLRYELAARHAFEAALEAFGQGGFDIFVDRSVEAQGILQEHGINAPFSENVGELVFSVLEPELTRLTLLADEGRAEAIGELLTLREQLERLSPWQGEPRWRVLSETTGAVLNELSVNVVNSAEQLVEGGQLQEAIDRAQHVADADLGDISDRAREFIDGWRQELELRLSLQAQQEHWDRIQQHVVEGRPIEAAQEIALYEQRYPDSERSAALQGVRTSIHDSLVKSIEELLRETQSAVANEDIRTMSSALKRLEGISIPQQLQADYDNLLRERDVLLARANALFRQVQEASALATAEQMIQVLQLAPLVLQLEPDRTEARELLERAQMEASLLATNLLRKAKLFRTSDKLQGQAHAMLQTVIQLDPDGELGAEARELLSGR